MFFALAIQWWSVEHAFGGATRDRSEPPYVGCYNLEKMLVDQPFGEIAIGVDAAVAEEGPVGAGLVDFAEVEFDDEGFVFFDAGFGEDFAGGAGDEALAPELDAVAGEFFVADTIGDGNVAAVGDRVAALNDFPGVVLFFVLGFFCGMPADGCWVEQDFCALHGGEARGFGIPLVPADEDTDFAVLSLPGAKAEVPGSEIKLFVIERIIRDMHLAVETEE